MARLSLEFLGPFRLSLDGQALAIRSARIRPLLAYLALEPARAHTREALAALFWPDATEHVARLFGLRQALYQLGQQLGKLVEPFLLLTRDTVQRNEACEYTMDVAAFLGHLGQGRLSEAVDLYGAELLTNLDCGNEPLAEWLALRREQLHLLALDSLHQLAEGRSPGARPRTPRSMPGASSRSNPGARRRPQWRPRPVRGVPPRPRRRAPCGARARNERPLRPDTRQRRSP